MTASPPKSADMTIVGVASEFASGVVTAEDIVTSTLATVGSLNGKYNAIIIHNPNVRQAALDLDRRREAGKPSGLLAGVPVVVKDTMDMVGLPTTGGSRSFYRKTGGIDLMPLRDAPVVARLREAGALIVGKTNVPVLSASGSHANNSWAGPTRNAVIEDRVPGGSSAGTATAVACGMCVMGLGEETGGSIQNPAAAQGLVGVTPTVGLVPNVGIMPLSSMRDVAGPITRTVRDAALCLDAIAGFCMEDPKTFASIGKMPALGYAAGLTPEGLAGRRLGLFGPGWRKEKLTSETAELYEAALGRIEAADAILVKDPFHGSGFSSLRHPTPGAGTFDGRGMESLPYDMQGYLERHGRDARIKTWAEFYDALKEADPFADGQPLAYLHNLPDFRSTLSNPWQPPGMRSFVELRAKYLQVLREVFARHALDALVFPQAFHEIPGLFSGESITETSVSEINVAGVPGVTVPAAGYRSGAPFGLILIGRPWSEGCLLSMAYAFEQLASARPRGGGSPSEGVR